MCVSFQVVRTIRHQTPSRHRRDVPVRLESHCVLPDLCPGRRDRRERDVTESRIRQSIRYLRTPDGVRIAWAEAGRGPTLVKASNWLTHLELEWESPVWR